jgi:acetyltransferase-like isoleucine patch superfamily enzyme
VSRALVERAIELFGRPRLRLLYLAWSLVGLPGIESINQVLLRRTRGVSAVLRQFGARIEGHCVIHGPLLIHNAKQNYANLQIGENAHVGRGVLLDLTGGISIESNATVSMGATVLTHEDVGARPLARRHPRRVEPTRIGAGAYVGANATILAGCHVGREAVVGAGAVVTRPVPDLAVVAGVPARVISDVEAAVPAD